jgi:hypothetical protein
MFTKKNENTCTETANFRSYINFGVRSGAIYCDGQNQSQGFDGCPSFQSPDHEIGGFWNAACISYHCPTSDTSCRVFLLHGL